MYNKRLIVLGAVVGVLLLATYSDSYGQRRGGGARGGGAVGGARGGYVAGPYGGGGAGAQRGGTVVGPGGGSASRGAGGGSYTTGRGTTVDYAGAGRGVSGPGGASAGRGVGGVQVTTPGGREATKVGTVGGVSGPGGRTAVGGSAVGVGSGPRGTAVTGTRGGAALGPGGAVGGGSRAGVAAGPGGVAVGGVRGGAAVNPYGLGGYSSAPGAVATGHRTTYVGRNAMRTQGVYVRQGFVHYNCFTPAWYGTHVHVWRPAAWTAAAFWTGAAWATVARTCSYPAEPVIYDYGSTIVYEDNRVYYDGEPVATAEEYATQATEIAAVGVKAEVTEKEEWVSLGVFGMVQGDEKDANKIFQLAINKDGVIRGTYYDALSDTESALSGSVDKKTQRAAWVVGDRKDTVYETGIGNLTDPETTMLVHFGKDRTQQWTLVRLEAPKDAK